MAERFVLATVKIATEGWRCASYCDAEPCPFLRSSWDMCALFGEELVNALDVDSDERVWIRVPACLALDALDAVELSPADAVARDLGAQHG